MSTTAADCYADKMRRAFDLVCPARYVAKCVEHGVLPAGTTGDWKGLIDALVTDDDLTEAGVTIDDVGAAVAFYTATEAAITREKIGGVAWASYSPAKDGYLVQAAGYRAGPAGDR